MFAGFLLCMDLIGRSGVAGNLPLFSWAQPGEFSAYWIFRTLAKSATAGVVFGLLVEHFLPPSAGSPPHVVSRRLVTVRQAAEAPTAPQPSKCERVGRRPCRCVYLTATARLNRLASSGQTMSRKQFVESQGGSCHNWTWSWSFINRDQRRVIVGARWYASDEDFMPPVSEELEQAALYGTEPAVTASSTSTTSFPSRTSIRRTCSTHPRLDPGLSELPRDDPLDSTRPCRDSVLYGAGAWA